MIFDDSWTQGLTKKQQNLIVDYVLNGCQFFQGAGGYKNKNNALKFLNSPEGRKALRKYAEFFIDCKKDLVKMRAIKLHTIRAFYNPADIIDKDGNFNLSDTEDLRKLGDLAYCIDGIETKEFYNDKGIVISKHIKIKICDRNKSIEFLSKVFHFDEEEKIEDFIGEKNVHEMSDEEIDADILKLIKKGKIALPAPEEKAE
jgi:hypothetical protein